MTITAAPPSHINKFQQLLRELFQFDCADLDFGIYRIMNYKRDAIETFITEKLIRTVTEELDRGPLMQHVRADRELEEAIRTVEEWLGDYVIDAQGNLDEDLHNTPAGQKYLKARAAADSTRGREAAEMAIFNHLYTFFSRYYQEGDFISKRRYSRRQRYAIPYNGEEVYLHWANSDQYYIKTAEHFHDYTGKAHNGVTVHFKLRAANLEQNNVKGDKRFFLPCIEDTEWDADTAEIIIPFAYRPLTAEEKEEYGPRKQQDMIIADGVTKIPQRLIAVPRAQAALIAERRINGKGEPVTFLEHHLRQYTRRNTSDFFIHKDLKGFLSRELDFYLKNEVLNLDDMENAGQDMAEGWFQMLRLIKSVGSQIIEFLGQLEGFQKMLWEKRKFVIGTEYCITVGNIDARFYPDIAGCDAQWDEWKGLSILTQNRSSGAMGADRRINFLKAHPTLVVDTRHFDEEFVDRLLASFDDLDGMTDGLLVHSENWQALNLLQEKYRERLDCIYIDPPYNTNENTFVYKNSYKHSSWLAMISNRLELGCRLLVASGVCQVAINDTETHYLRTVLDSIFGQDNRVATIAAEINPAGQNLRPNTPALSHDYCLFYAVSIDEMNMLLRELTTAERKVYTETDSAVPYLWDNLRRRGGNSRPSDRPGQKFPLFVKDNTVRVPDMYWDQSEKRWVVTEEPYEGEIKVWPVDPKGEARIWRVNPDGARKGIEQGDISVTTKAGRLEVIKKSYMPDGKKPKTLWKDSKHSATTHGTRLLNDILGKQAFSYPKSIFLVMDCLRFWMNKAAVVADYFAGSGTTGHAVINLNREDGGNRKFILVEMGDYFNTVLLPRIKKVIFTPEWRDGQPKRMATPAETERSPRILKYIRLESYEDTLNNIEIDHYAGQIAMNFGFDDYLLKYMLKWETKDSETLLNVEKLTNPFRYQLNVQVDGQTRKRVADVPETFNYLLGLHVRTRRIYADGGRHYLVYQGETRENPSQRVAVIWREIEGWQKQDFTRDKHFVAENHLAAGADVIYVNGDSCIPNAKGLDPLFKSRMFAGLHP